MRKLLAGLLLALSPVTASASTIYSAPGDIFDFPQSGLAYKWKVTVPWIEGTVVESFTVRVQGAPQWLETFQVFGQCEPPEPKFYAGFDLSVVNSNGTDTVWTNATRGGDLPCGYHDYLEKTLPVGESIFTVTYNGADEVPMDSWYVEFRFGYIDAAIPVPGGLVLLPAALVALGGIGMWSKKNRKHHAAA